MKKFVAVLAVIGIASFAAYKYQDSSEEVKESPSASVSYNYVANKNSGKLHSINCDSLPYEENRIYFSSVEEANRAGYTDNHKECMGS